MVKAKVTKYIHLMKSKIDWVLIITGSFLISNNLLGFRSRSGYGFSLRGSSEKIFSWAYSYDGDTRFYFAVGVCLLVWGMLIRNNKRATSG